MISAWTKLDNENAVLGSPQSDHNILKVIGAKAVRQILEADQHQPATWSDTGQDLLGITGIEGRESMKDRGAAQHAGCSTSKREDRHAQIGRAAGGECRRQLRARGPPNADFCETFATKLIILGRPARSPGRPPTGRIRPILRLQYTMSGYFARPPCGWATSRGPRGLPCCSRLSSGEG